MKMVLPVRRYYNGKSLSQVASSLYRLAQEDEAAFREIRLFGAPSECYGDVSRGTQKRIRAVLTDAGLTADQYRDEVCARLSGGNVKVQVIVTLADYLD